MSQNQSSGTPSTAPDVDAFPSVDEIRADPQRWIDEWEPLVAMVPNPQTGLPGLWTMLAMAKDFRRVQRRAERSHDQS